MTPASGSRVPSSTRMSSDVLDSDTSRSVAMSMGVSAPTPSAASAASRSASQSASTTQSSSLRRTSSMVSGAEDLDRPGGDGREPVDVTGRDSGGDHINLPARQLTGHPGPGDFGPGRQTGRPSRRSMRCGNRQPAPETQERGHRPEPVDLEPARLRVLGLGGSHLRLQPVDLPTRRGNGLTRGRDSDVVDHSRQCLQPLGTCRPP